MAEPEQNDEQHRGPGRPSKYTEAMPERLKDYVDRGYKGDGDVIPTKAGFAFLVQVCEDTLDNWGRAHPEFFGMLRYLMARQHQLLMNSGLKGEFSQVIAKLLLCSDHGHTERSDTTSGGKPIQPSIINFHEALVAAKQEQAGDDPTS